MLKTRTWKAWIDSCRPYRRFKKHVSLSTLFNILITLKHFSKTTTKFIELDSALVKDSNPSNFTFVSLAMRFRSRNYSCKFSSGASFSPSPNLFTCDSRVIIYRIGQCVDLKFSVNPFYLFSFNFVGLALFHSCHFAIGIKAIIFAYVKDASFWPPLNLAFVIHAWNFKILVDIIESFFFRILERSLMLHSRTQVSQSILLIGFQMVPVVGFLQIFKPAFPIFFFFSHFLTPLQKFHSSVFGFGILNYA